MEPCAKVNTISCVFFFLCVCHVCVCRWQPGHQGLPAHPGHHAGGPVTRGGPGQEEQLQERRGEPAGDPGVSSVERRASRPGSRGSEPSHVRPRVMKIDKHLSDVDVCVLKLSNMDSSRM